MCQAAMAARGAKKVGRVPHRAIAESLVGLQAGIGRKPDAQLTRGARSAGAAKPGYKAQADPVSPSTGRCRDAQRFQHSNPLRGQRVIGGSAPTVAGYHHGGHGRQGSSLGR